MAEMRVSTTGRYFALGADNKGPVFQKFAVLEADIYRVGDESRGPDGVTPIGEEAQNVMLGESREREEFRTRGGAASAAGDSENGIQNVLLVGRWFHGAFSVY